MNIVVKKFGGSSLANADRICHVADLIISRYQQGNPVVVVVSAMYGETDRLIDFAKMIQNFPDPREYSVLVSSGEQIAMALLCMAIINKGFKAKSYTGSQLKIMTDGNYQDARIKNIDIANIKNDLERGIIVVVAGFQGVDNNGSITTLGRGGSDTTAVALAAVLSAKECIIYTDVDGVYTADPKLVPEAKRLKNIFLEEMLVLSQNGAKVLQQRSVELAGKYNMPVKVLSSFISGDEGGTVVLPSRDDVEFPIVRSIAYIKEIIMFDIVVANIDLVDIGEITSTLFSGNNLNADMITCTSNGTRDAHLKFVVPEDMHDNILPVFDTIKEKIDIKSIDTKHSLSKISIVGIGLRSHDHVNILKIILNALKLANVKVYMVASSDIRISIVIDNVFYIKALNILHEILELNKIQK